MNRDDALRPAARWQDCDHYLTICIHCSRWVAAAPVAAVDVPTAPTSGGAA